MSEGSARFVAVFVKLAEQVVFVVVSGVALNNYSIVLLVSTAAVSAALRYFNGTVAEVIDGVHHFVVPLEVILAFFFFVRGEVFRDFERIGFEELKVIEGVLYGGRGGG